MSIDYKYCIHVIYTCNFVNCKVTLLKLKLVLKISEKEKDCDKYILTLVNVLINYVFVIIIFVKNFELIN